MQTGNGKLAVVTGASRGIGKALCEALIERGWQVVAASRGGGDVGQATGVACDLATEAGREQLVSEVRAMARPVDLWVNNAGVQFALDFAAPGPEVPIRAEQELALNLLAPVALTAAAVPLMTSPDGTIVNVTSLVALHPKGSAPVYSASKAGLSSFTRAMRQQLLPAGIRVVEVMPPVVATDMTEGRNDGALTASEMAKAILDGVANGREVVAPGKAALVRRLDRLAPGLVARKIGAM